MTALFTKESRHVSGVAQVPEWIGQAVRFGIVGLLNTLVDAVVYLLLTRGLPFFALYPALAKACSYSVGVLNSFFWNRKWTFRSQAGWRAFLPFVLVNLAGVLLNAAAMQFGLAVLGLPEALAFIGATGLTLVWNFLVSKWIVFRPAISPAAKLPLAKSPRV